MDTVPPQVDVLQYNRSTPGMVDHVLIFGRRHATPQTLHDPATQRLDRQVAAAYRLIAVSRPSGLLQLYVLRGQAGSAVPDGLHFPSRAGSLHAVYSTSACRCSCMRARARCPPTRGPSPSPRMP